MPVTIQEPIQNRHLRISQIPALDITSLRDDGWDRGPGYATDDWSALWNFALTFQAYRYFGDDSDRAANRVAEFGSSVRESYLDSKQLPKLDLALLRTCLFYEQRAWCKHSMVAPPAEV